MEYQCRVEKIWVEDDDVKIQISVLNRSVGVSGVKLTRKSKTNEEIVTYIYEREGDNTVWEARLCKHKLMMESKDMQVAIYLRKESETANLVDWTPSGNDTMSMLFPVKI